MNPIAVSQINYYIEEHLRTDPVLRKVSIRGEVANLNKKGQWAFFHLKDDAAMLACVSFEALPEEIQEGNLVVAQGTVRFYAKRGNLRLQITDIAIETPSARAAKRKAAEDHFRKLGWFDHKRTFPAYPNRIGLITSKDGAAIDDVRRNIERRYPFVTLVVIPVQVQGLKAPLLIAKAFERASRQKLDGIILTRGGGDTSDLEVFDDERVVEAVYHSPIPVVAAIGHEKDWTFAEMAADARASTPTGAAEFIVPTRFEIREQLRKSAWRSLVLMEQSMDVKRARQLYLLTRSAQSCDQSIDRKNRSLVRTRNESVGNMHQRIKGFNAVLVAARDTETKLDKKWEPYRFFIRNIKGKFVRNDTLLQAGTYTILGEKHKQSVRISEEE